MDKHLHIVCFTIPYPPNFGGVIEVYYKIKALAKAGIKIHLHCYQYDRQPSVELEQYCTEIKYYHRKTRRRNFFKWIPYIIASRQSKELSRNLLMDDYPVLLEGIHCSYPLLKKEFAGKEFYIRQHNIEHRYYYELGKNEQDFFRKSFFFNEALKLKLFEKKLARATKILTISHPEQNYYFKKFKGKSVYLPAFHPHDKMSCLPGKGAYAIYHGNLGINENLKALEFILTNVYDKINIPLVIAGQNVSSKLRQYIHNFAFAKLIENPGHEEFLQLLRNAHVNILPTFQGTGIKLKLLNSLFAGRYCLVNSFMVNGSGLSEMCVIADSGERMRNELLELFEKEFSETEIKRREEILNKEFSNEKNGKKLIGILFHSKPQQLGDI